MNNWCFCLLYAFAYLAVVLALVWPAGYFFSFAPPLAALVLAYRLRGRDFFASLGLARDRVPAGVGIGLAAALFFAAAIAAKVYFQGSGYLYTDWTREQWMDMIVLPGFGEELLFRGCLLGLLTRRAEFARANLGVAFLFACIHLPSWLLEGQAALEIAGSFVYIFGLGWVFGRLFLATRSLWAPVLLHAANNALVLLTIGIRYTTF